MDTLAYLSGLENDVMGSWRRRARNEMYRQDPEAWLWDVLGYRWHDKQREIVHNFMTNRRVATKSANGTGKTRLYAELIAWGIAVHEPGELLVIVTGPSKEQVKGGMFGYLDKNINRARERGFELPGYLTDSNTWAYRPNGGRAKAKTLVLGRTPPRSNIVGTFQGIRAVADTDVKTWVFMDEGGAVHDDLFVAAEAVTTGAGDNKIGVIGNPDQTGTYFQKIFEDKKIMADWATSTISAFDLPTFTGERVYDDEEAQRQMLTSGMIDYEWVEQKKRSWGEDSARYKSKVKGEFPDGDDWSFFSQVSIDRAENTVVIPDGATSNILGIDLADNSGAGDDSKAYVNMEGPVQPDNPEDERPDEDRPRGACIRHYQTWNEGRESANRIHEAALSTEAEIVVADRLGVGAGPVSVVEARSDRFYTVVGARASEKSPDPSRWANARAYWYDTFREGMLNGLIDLDFHAVDDQGNDVGNAMRNQLLSIRFEFNNKGAVQIEPKKEMRKRGVPSPDDLDAAIFTYGLKVRELLGDPLSAMKPGSVVLEDPWAELDEEMIGLGMPI